MFSNTESKLITKLITEHVSKLEQTQQAKTETPEKLSELSVEQKIAVTILAKLNSDADNGADKSLQTVDFSDPVLIVDDDLLCREMLTSLLKEIGFTKILNELDGYRAISTIKKQKTEGKPVKMVLCDWNMPNMSGLELLDIMRKDEHLATIPFFLVTSNHDKAHIMRALKAGVTGYLVKPLAFKTLRAKLLPHCKTS